MRFSQLFVQTLRETPSDAEVASHQLLARAGYIMKLASGIYSYTPLMLRVLQKVSNIVRDEMNKAGAQELLMPILQPADLWEESGRWALYGKELLRLKDRHDRELALAPTHEEVITSLARANLKSYKQLPVNLYQIQNKYRDEPRPRFGLLRGREFIMKDAYSFHSNQACLEREYDVMAEAYTAIFERCGLKTVMVRSDSGAIGGAVSHEFMLLTGNQPEGQQSGENDVVFAEDENGNMIYAANIEKAESRLERPVIDGAEWHGFQKYKEPTLIDTPKTDSIDKLCEFLDCLPWHICKTLVYVTDTGHKLAVMIRGDYEVEETKLKNLLKCNELRMATEAELHDWLGTKKGFVGFASDGLCFKSDDIRNPAFILDATSIIMDESVRHLKHFLIADNVPHKHWVGAHFNDATLALPFVDIRKVKEGDLCPVQDYKHLPLKITRGIEVGNIFQLGTKYSEAMKAMFADENGTEQPFIMGCYGIGVSRVAASAVERFHDADGILWPPAIAPYTLVIVPANTKDEVQSALAERLYKEALAAGWEVLLDDRDQRAGVKFKDADLLGFPLRVTVGKKAVEGLVEVKRRDLKESQDLPADGDLFDKLKALLAGWNPALS
jgi:prolyl-tRNA synthetase